MAERRTRVRQVPVGKPTGLARGGRGYEADWPLQVSERGEAHWFCWKQAQCQACGKRAGHAVEGHATLARKREDDSIQVLDILGVACVCDHTTPVFFRHYGPLGDDPEEYEFLGADGNFGLVSCSGTSPMAWLSDILKCPATA